MMLWRKSLWLIGSLLSLFLVGCATTPSSYNYDALLAAKPRSILVIPPKKQLSRSECTVCLLVYDQ